MDKKTKKDPENSLDFVTRHYEDGRFDTRQAWENFSSSRKIRKVSMRSLWMKVAAAAVILVISGSVFYSYQTRDISLMTKAGEKKELYLPDGTFVILQERSKISYNNWSFNRERRELQMEGIISFQVAKDAAKVFSIQAGLTNVEVLGTSFDLMSDAKATCIDVTSGKVSFRSLDGTMQSILVAGMSAVYEQTNLIMRAYDEKDGIKVNPGNKKMEFNNTPLDRVVQQLEFYYGVSLVYDQPEEQLNLTAQFENMKLDDILNIINSTLDTNLTLK